MTRETKLGLGVGVSFLSLVAVVAYTTLQNKGEEVPPAPEAPPPAQVAKATNVETPGKAPTNTSAVKQAKLEVSAPPLQFPLVEPSPASNARPAAPPAGGNPAGPGLPPPDVVVAPSLPLPPAGGVEPPYRQPNIQNIEKKPLLGSFPAADNQQVAVAPKPAMVGDLPLPPSGPAPVAPPPGGLTIPPSASATPPALAVPQPKDAVTFPGTIPPPGGSVTPKSVPMSDVPLLAKAPATPRPGTPENLSPLPPPGGPVPIDKPVTPPPGPVGNPIDLKQPLPNPIAPPASANPLDRKAPNNPVPELQTGNALVSPSIPVPAGPPTPATPPAASKVQVNEFKDVRHVCGPNDTDFAALSKRFYQTEAYAQALQAYNREHQSTSEAVRQGGRLQSGDQVYIPDLHALESRQNNAAPPPASGLGAAPKPLAPIAVTPAPSVPVKEGPATSGSPIPLLPPTAGPVDKPPAIQPVQPMKTPTPAPAVTPVNPQPIASADSTGPTKTYVVQQGGQHFYHIAREALGDGDRWPEIWRLNQQYSFETAVPAGARIQLPAEARVGQ